jgi:hypothetical protein
LSVNNSKKNNDIEKIKTIEYFGFSYVALSDPLTGSAARGQEVRMSRIRSKKVGSETVYHEYVSHEVCDPKRREVGSALVIVKAHYEPVGEHATSGYTVEPGTYFEATNQSYRNGVPFGASQHYKLFESFEAAKAHLDKSVKRSIARSRKQFGAGIEKKSK